jgi:hypothetical protein
MYSHELVELAAIVSAHGPVLVQGVDRISEGGLEQYWTASKVRLDRWCRSLRNFANQAGDAKWRQCHWPRIESLLEEIVSTEMLTRVWGAVLCAHDRRHQLSESEPIARSVLLGHLEARHRVLKFLINTPGIEYKAAVRLNQLHNATERWTDLLVGYLAEMGDLSEFAADPARAKDFGQDFLQGGDLPGRGRVWPLIYSSLRSRYHRESAPSTPNSDVNLRIASSILGCFPGDLFDSTGQFQSLWIFRLGHVAADAQGMIEELLHPIQPEAQNHTILPNRTSRRLRDIQ